MIHWAPLQDSSAVKLQKLPSEPRDSTAFGARLDDPKRMFNRIVSPKKEDYIGTHVISWTRFVYWSIFRFVVDRNTLYLIRFKCWPCLRGKNRFFTRKFTLPWILDTRDNQVFCQKHWGFEQQRWWQNWQNHKKNHAEFEARKSVATANEIHSDCLSAKTKLVEWDTLEDTKPMQVWFERQEGLNFLNTIP